MAASPDKTNGTHKKSMETVNDVIRGASEYNAVPLWPQMAKFNPPQPNPRCVPDIWRYEDVRPFLIRAGDLVKEKDAERRVLMLVNSERKGPYTTDTLYAGLQLILPDETAPAHRHTASAMRFIIEGHGGFTAINGSRLQMSPGDVILTPSWTWHDHGKHGAGPMIWLDALDLPLFQFLPVHFVEHFKEKRYPAEDVAARDSELVFPWATMKGVLDGVEGAWAAREYRKKDGTYVTKTLNPSAERINPGTTTPSRRETASSVYHVIRGAGESNIGGTVLRWKKGDTFCVPSWYPYRHTAGKGETVYLYRFDDRPVMEALGFYVKSGGDGC